MPIAADEGQQKMIPRYKLTCTGGTTQDTRLVNLETGEEIKHIASIEIEKIVPNALVNIKVELHGVELEITCLGDQFKTFTKGRKE